MCVVRMGAKRPLDQGKSKIRKNIIKQAEQIEFHKLWRTGARIVPAGGEFLIRIDNQGKETDVADSAGNKYGPGQRIAAQSNGKTFAVVYLDDSLSRATDQDAVVQAVRDALEASAKSDPGRAYVVVPA